MSAASDGKPHQPHRRLYIATGPRLLCMVFDYDAAPPSPLTALPLPWRFLPSLPSSKVWHSTFSLPLSPVHVVGCSNPNRNESNHKIYSQLFLRTYQREALLPLSSPLDHAAVGIVTASSTPTYRRPLRLHCHGLFLRQAHGWSATTAPLSISL